MSEAVKLLLKGSLGWIGGLLALLVNPKVWLLIALAVGIGFIRGCVDEKHRFDEFLDAQKQLAAVQDAHRKAVNQRNQDIEEAIDHDAALENAALHDQLDAATARLRAHASGNGVPRPSPGPAQPVPARNEQEAIFLARIYAGTIVCYDSGALDQGLRERRDRLLRELAGLAQPAVDALDDSRWWGEWAAQVGACKAGG